jgi:hypothetical protein
LRKVALGQRDMTAQLALLWMIGNWLFVDFGNCSDATFVQSTAHREWQLRGNQFAVASVGNWAL